MAHTIIGTAGHIDHGKTLLVKALADPDTDRTPQERAALQSLGRVVAFDGGLLLHAEVVEWARDELRRFLEENGEITVAQFRSLIDGNRRYALALLGYFDREGFSERRGDVRVLKA